MVVSVVIAVLNDVADSYVLDLNVYCKLIVFCAYVYGLVSSLLL